MGKRNQHVIDALRDGILAHYKRARAESISKSHERYPKGYTISYGELIEFAKVRIIPLAAGGYLFEVARQCKEDSWHPIHSLVVNKATGWPGPNFRGSPQAAQNYDAWKADIYKLIDDPRFPQRMPVT